jgi:penicillin-binding protein 1A
VAQKALQEGLDNVVKRNSYRGAVKHLKGKEQQAFLDHQIRMFQKYPPRKGILVKALVVQGDRKSPGVPLRLGNHPGLLAAPGGGSSTSGRGKARESALKPGDVVQVRLMGQDRQRRWIGSLEPTSMVQGALISMELKTGKVRTLIGGRDFGDSAFNRAVQAHRQAGSAFKPVIYAAAVEQGYGPNSILQDSPLSLPGGRHGQAWTPQNYDHSYSGPITLATAIARSRNVPAVRMMMAVGVPSVVKMAKTLGIASPIYPNYASALGASEVTPLELTRAYSVFPNRGNLIEAIFIDRIEDRDGRVLFEAKPRRQQVLTQENADTMTQLLLGVVERGTATRVKVLKRPIGGKTGTTNNTRDAWFIGFTPSLITGVWVGMDEKLSLGPKETGSQASAPIFIAYMSEALKGQAVEQFADAVRSPAARPGEREQDDEETEGEDESFYPEDNTLTEQAPKPAAPSKNFYKQDLEG